MSRIRKDNYERSSTQCSVLSLVQLNTSLPTQMSVSALCLHTAFPPFVLNMMINWFKLPIKYLPSVQNIFSAGVSSLSLFKVDCKMNQKINIFKFEHQHCWTEQRSGSKFSYTLQRYCTDLSESVFFFPVCLFCLLILCVFVLIFFVNNVFIFTYLYSLCLDLFLCGPPVPPTFNCSLTWCLLLSSLGFPLNVVFLFTPVEH